MRKKNVIVAGVCTCMLGLALTSCIPATETGTPPDPAPEGGYRQLEAGGLDAINGQIERTSSEYAPKVNTLEDGRQVQLVPDDGYNSVYSSNGMYNTYFLNAENRGCDSCHTEGLYDLIENMPYVHWDMSNGLKTNEDVTDCLGCHEEEESQTQGGLNAFGSIIHGIHSKDSFNGDCMSCHDATTGGTDMRLWEQAKYGVLSGISDVPDVTGEFSFDQTTLGGENTEWTYWESEAEAPYIDSGLKDRFDVADLPSFDEWEISVTGLVGEEKSWTLSELIALAQEKGAEDTFISTMCCEINDDHGEWITTAEITGINVKWILEELCGGVTDDATAVTVIGADGYGGPDLYGGVFNQGFTLDQMEEEGTWLVYEINGHRLTMLEGYPVRAWTQGHAISNSTRWASEINVNQRDPELHDGIGLEGVVSNVGVPWTPNEETGDAKWYNNPSVAVMDTPEGLIIPTGQPYTFEGYAYSYNDQITAVEFSMDGGETWTSFDTSDSNKYVWTYWRFNWTPETDGAYVLQVRARTAQGWVSYQPDQVMVNAKSA